jgi:hypothetical protein
MKSQPKIKHGPTNAARKTLAVVVLGLLGAAALPPVQEGALVADARDVLQRWVEVRRQVSKEKQDWALGRELMESRIALVQGQIDDLGAKIQGVEANVLDTEGKLAELGARKAALTGTVDELANSLAQLEERTRTLLRRLPDPLREKLRPISQSLPADSASADKGKLGERFLTVVGILNEVNKFNREIRVESEIRTLGAGSSVEVTTLYVGLGQAYYASGDGKSAGFGSPGTDGWNWTEANDRASEITRAIAILTKGADAEFVNLPVKLQ